MDLEEEAFYEIVDEAMLTLPFQFRNWKAHFTSQESFLAEASAWIHAEFEGMPKRVVTDVAMGRGCFNTELIKNGRVSSDDGILYIDEEDQSSRWGDEYEWVNPPQTKREWVKGRGYVNYWQPNLFRRQLPLEPEIEAPNGISGKNLVVL